LEGQEFLDVNQVLQRALVYENRAKDHRSYIRFKGGAREKQHVGMIEDESASDDDAEVCVAEWVDTPKDKPITYPFLKPNVGKKEEVKYTFDVPKCDRLFDVLVRGGVIRLSEGHVVRSAEQLAKKKYCKWHNSYSHTTNECNYFCWQVQSALNDDQLTLGDGGKMKLDTNPVPVDMIELGEKRYWCGPTKQRP
jgi:hypothetical protein